MVISRMGALLMSGDTHVQIVTVPEHLVGVPAQSEYSYFTQTRLWMLLVIIVAVVGDGSSGKKTTVTIISASY